MDDFSGVKVALILGNQLIAIQRDNKPGLAYAGMWDLPGGGRDAGETPFATVAREVQEELGITLREQSVRWLKAYPALKDPQQISYFMVVTITDSDVAAIQFGNEGIGWRLVSLNTFMADGDVIEPLKQHLNNYLAIAGE